MSARLEAAGLLLLLCACGGGLSVESVTPSTLPARGGQVTVRGRGFKPGMSAWLGEASVVAEVKDDQSAVVQVPPGRAGALRLKVRVGRDEALLEKGLTLLPLELAFAEAPTWSMPELPGPVTKLAAAGDGLLAAGPFGAVVVRGGAAGWSALPLGGLAAEDGTMPAVDALSLLPSGMAGVACTRSGSPLHWLSSDDGPLRVAASSGALDGRCLAVALGAVRAERAAWVAFQPADGGTRTLMRWAGGESAEEVTSPPLPAVLHVLAAQDLDADGDEDLLVAGQDGAEARTEAWLQEDGGFVQGPALHRTSSTRGAAVLDVDADGDMDVLAVGSGADSLWVNDGEGRFVDDAWRRLPYDRSEAHGLALADLDLDGAADAVLAVPGAMDRLVLARDGGFVDATTALGLSPGHGGTACACVDLDLDGDLDVATALPDGGLRVRLSVPPAPGDGTP